MFKISIGFGVALALVGIVGYVATGAQSPTALIPTFLGILLIVAGWLARNPAMRKHAMHGAAAISVIGLAGTSKGFLKLPVLLTGGTVDRVPAVIAQGVTFLLCAVFLVLCVKSFIDARRAASK